MKDRAFDPSRASEDLLVPFFLKPSPSHCKPERTSNVNLHLSRLIAFFPSMFYRFAQTFASHFAVIVTHELFFTKIPPIISYQVSNIS